MYYLSHDGTLLFIKNMFWERTYSRLLNSVSIGKRNIETLFVESDFDEQGHLLETSHDRYDIRYLLSDLLWHSEHIDHVDEENGKMFPGQRDSYAISVRCEMSLRNTESKQNRNFMEK